MDTQSAAVDRRLPATQALSHPGSMIERMFRSQSPAAPCPCSEVAQQAATSYETRGYQAAVSPVPWADDDSVQCEGRFVVVPALQHVDFVAESSGDLIATVEHLSGPVKAGWDLWAVVPLARLAEAHDVFRDSVDFVQGWWTAPSGEVSFTSPEIP